MRRDLYLRRPITRRTLLKGTGAAAVVAATRPGLRAFAQEGAPEVKPCEPTRDIAGSELKILQWSHFVPRYDQWFDQFLADWGAEHGVNASVDHINVADVPARISAEIAAGEGHDLVEYIAPLPHLEPSMMDLTDLNEEAQKRFGEQVPFTTRSSFNPNTGVFYGFTHGWAPDPGDYRASLWEQVGMPNGPATWDDLLTGGSQIKQELGTQLGIGMSNEIDSNMAARALIWSFGGAVQDECENVVINSPETVAAVQYMADLYQNAMTPEVFSWNAASNNQLLIAGNASYILNSISAYRTAQTAQPEVAKDIFFTPALTGPGGEGWANGHAIFVYYIPKFAKNPDAAKEFILCLMENYPSAVYQSELYNFPAFESTAPELYADGGWLDNDPFGSEPADKLAVLKNARDWTTNVGHPGPANAAIGEVFATFVLPNMMAKAARGEMTAEEAVAWAEEQIVPIFEKWRAEGLVGGGEC